MPNNEHNTPPGFLSLMGNKARRIDYEVDGDQFCRDCFKVVNGQTVQDIATWFIGESEKDRECFCDYHFLKQLTEKDLVLVMSAKAKAELYAMTKRPEE